ncbi:hypothetical protein PTSG_01536 [Salpingoeca rosetta]|uniref:Glycoside hydrolase n=1 Tax=Salpingoeca rosetta (strain ATCC 50818 / BSB-021) TaxID=946362 RepID=F2U0M5_SALR5|nr:uncharacterized protein PTSG_01536 [Salpingoeca rosetta]EGD80953.1 hypothetical protein PTSG_01536 [Salpingoeca rosetta]|eukprot:XP_004997514.1 hypothetical protein PTSG_01536 [Salpingoeca rosetta]
MIKVPAAPASRCSEPVCVPSGSSDGSRNTSSVLCNLEASDLTIRGHGDVHKPVIDSNHPDPGVLIQDGVVYAVTTSGDAPDAFPIMTSTDMVNWKLSGHVFPANAAGRPTWAVRDFWAPEIHRISASQYNVYFAARHKDGTLSVGVATGPTPLGPFSDLGAPLVHTPGMGNIDASFFRDGDNDYVIWKRDGNGAIPPVPTPIFVQRVINNGTTLAAEPYVAITNDQPWEGPLVEGPWIVKQGGMYYMFFSANGFTSPKYAIGVARSPNITGPYEKYASNPILHRDADASNPAGFTGPGHCSVVQTPHAKQWYVVYHAWHNGRIGGSNPRIMAVDELAFDQGDHWPHLTHNRTTPSFTPQPLPQV